MTVLEHLEELRKRLTIALIAVAVGAIAGWVLYPQVFHLLIHSFKEACQALPKHNKPPIPWLHQTRPMRPLSIRVFFILLSLIKTLTQSSALMLTKVSTIN